MAPKARKRKSNAPGNNYTPMESQEHGELRSQGSISHVQVEEASDRNTNQNGAKIHPKRRTSKEKSSKGIFMILIVMVVITWAIAATAYFGVINYKALIEKLKYIDKRRPVAANNPMQKNSYSLEDTSNIKRDTSNFKKDSASSSQKTQEDTTAKKEKPKPSKKPETEAIDEMSQYNSANDQSILKELAKGEALLKKNKGKEALNFYKKLIATNPKSPRAMFGKAQAQFVIADQERSNQIIEEGIESLDRVGKQPGCPSELHKKAILLKTDKYIFLGRHRDSFQTAMDLYKQMPKDVQVINKLGVCYLYLGKNAAAKQVFEKALAENPNDGFAQVHYGFIVKAEGDWEAGARYLQMGIESQEPGTQQGKFYMHLGDALHRTNRTQEAEDLYQLGAEKGLFLSKYQRSLYNIDRLKSRPFWTPEQAKVTSYVNTLEKKWKIIRDEALKIMDVENGLFLPEEESLKNTGDWKQLTLYARGREQKDCKRMPKTCAIIQKMPNAIGCKRGQVKFSIMQPGTHVWAHTGPTNCRLRMHLGLVVPTTGEGAKIRCADQYKTWQEGKVLIFDDSFEHEVWQYAETYRLILIMDVWHPDITESEKRTLSPI